MAPEKSTFTTSRPTLTYLKFFIYFKVCQNGWTYDEEWYASTIPSEQNWVCEKDLYVTNVFVVSRVVEVVGAVVFGQLGDS